MGDVVDHRPDSIKILHDMMLRSNVFGIIGNHELMMVECLNFLCDEITDTSLDAFNEEKLMKLSEWIYNEASPTIEAFKKFDMVEKEEILEYLMEFTIYEEVEVHGRFYILVHARFASSDDYDIHDFVWNRLDFDKLCFSGSKYIVVGHTPTLGITGEPEIIYKL